MSPTDETKDITFDTAMGRCAIAWRNGRIARVTLLEPSPPSSRVIRAGKLPTGLPAYVSRAVRRIQSHLAGDLQSFADVPLAWDALPPFHQRASRVALGIPPGRTMTYGEVALKAGSPGGARAVGQAMQRNPFPLIIPCHRVVAAIGLGGFSSVGGVTTKKRLLELERGAVEARWRQGEARWPFDLDRARDHLRGADPTLGRAIDRLGHVHYEPHRGSSPFQTLFRSIVYQQLSGKAAGTIHGRVLALYRPKRHPSPEQILATPDARLRGAGLSRNKTAAVKDLARKVIDGTVPSLAILGREEDEQVIERLVAVRGIGRWTAEMFLIFRLGRPDVMPADDLGVRKGFQIVYRKRALPSSAALLKHAQRWRPYRTAATWYLYQAADTSV